MRRRFQAAVAVLLLWAAVNAAPLASAQYTQGLPQGILNVEVDGQPIDAVTVPVTNNATPEIAGRVDLGVAAIDLAVANGNVIRFQGTLDERGRFRVTVPQALTDGQYSLYINDVLIGAFTISGALPEEREPGQLLDIARVVPYPADFGELIPGIGFLDGRFYTIEEEAARTAAAAGDQGNTRAAQRGLVEAGWLQRYENRLAAPSADDPSSFSVQISSFVVEYASGADARSAYAGLVGDGQGVDFPTIGNESFLTLLTGTTPDTNTDYQAARLVFRVGSMVAMIVYADLTNQPPNLDLLYTVAQTVAERGIVVADRQTVPLGSMALRLDPSTATGRIIRRDLYDARAGTLTALYNEDEATREIRVALLTGTTDAFTSTTSGTFAEPGGRGDRADREQEAPAAPPTPTSVIGIEGEAPAAAPATPPPTSTQPPAEAELATAQVSMISALYAFPGEAEADAWLAAQREQLLANPESDGATFAEVTDAPRLGDAAATFATLRPLGDTGETISGYRVYARLGSIVAVLDVTSSPDLALRNATNLMEQQLACIEALGCAGAASLPGNLFASRDRASPPSTPGPDQNAEATPASAMPPSESVIIVEGDTPASQATEAARQDGEERPNRERRRDRNNDEGDTESGG